ncbi:endonuclease [Shewanella surugensis]|uniref:Endonuclease n=1 Tax=Shewanella surugensis TaxID=212020 RepID=A0ABT0L6L2_9GAMM|nr:endonuclease [Shewanella surugensis]MCL1123323.1 endonuclease [Shewanella surugensis]
MSLSVLLSSGANAAGNTSNQSFSKAKKQLLAKVYPDHRQTIYCGASFDKKKNITPPAGFKTSVYKKRAKKVEWEHVVPAENFGRAFVEWREGNKACVNSKGKSFKGRKCAEKVNTEYRYMQADMYNLYPAIGAVNALRSNYNFTMLSSAKSDFGQCDMRIEKRKAQPPVKARGRIARTYMYMQAVYPKYKMSKQQQKLMASWDKQYPVSKWECTRAKRIQKIQGNVNQVVASRCKAVGF